MLCFGDDRYLVESDLVGLGEHQWNSLLDCSLDARVAKFGLWCGVSNFDIDIRNRIENEELNKLEQWRYREYIAIVIKLYIYFLSNRIRINWCPTDSGLCYFSLYCGRCQLANFSRFCFHKKRIALSPLLDEVVTYEERKSDLKNRWAVNNVRPSVKRLTVKNVSHRQWQIPHADGPCFQMTTSFIMRFWSYA